MNPGFWAGKKIFITGHTGFKGAWLSLWLHQLGASVTGYALRPPTIPSLFDLCRIADFTTAREQDVRDFSGLLQGMEAVSPDVVFHLAAQSLVRRSYDSPLETYAINVMGTAHLLEAVRRCDSVRAVVVVTSDKCYENVDTRVAHREEDPMGGFDPYSSSKGCAELVTSAYRQSFFSNSNPPSRRTFLASARAGNVIGGGDWAADRLIPDVLTAFYQRQPALIRNPGAVRPWQHVLEPLCGYLQLAEKLWDDGEQYTGAWNFGPVTEDAKSVAWVVDRLVAMWGAEAGWSADKSAQPHEAPYLSLDSSKARSRLNWTPRLDLDTALEWVVDWHRSYLNGRDIRAITLEQISHYQSRAS